MSERERSRTLTSPMHAFYESLMLERANVSLAEMTTLGLGGPAARLIDVQSEAELASVATDTDEDGTPLLVLGGGSNVVVEESGWLGTVLRPALKGIEAAGDGDRVRIRVGAGECWDELVERCVGEGWGGLACLSGIPGWTGAAPVQNIGAYGHEVGEYLVEVCAFDRQTGAFSTIARDACEMGYRTSVFRHQERYILTSLTLLLERKRTETVRYAELANVLGIGVGDSAPASQVRSAVIELRSGKGMIVDASDPESRSAGSFFVNPIVDGEQLRQLEARALCAGIVEDAAKMPRFAASPGRWKVPAAWLIERSGFHKGTTVSGIGISRKHALALVNRGGTTADLLAFERTVRNKVFETFGVSLSREPVLVGSVR